MVRLAYDMLQIVLSSCICDKMTPRPTGLASIVRVVSLVGSKKTIMQSSAIAVLIFSKAH